MSQTSETQDLTRILQKIAKLRALASSSNPHEAAAAAAQADALLQKYRITTAEADGFEMPDLDPVQTECDGVETWTGRPILWQASLLSVLCGAYGCTWLYEQRRKENGDLGITAKLVGRKSDMQIVRFMYAWLSAEATRLAGKLGRGNGRTWHASFCMGFVAGVWNAMKESTEQARSGATSTALALIDKRKSEAEQHLQSAEPNLKMTKSKPTVRDGRAFTDGEREGRQARLHKAIGDGATPRLVQGS